MITITKTELKIDLLFIFKARAYHLSYAETKHDHTLIIEDEDFNEFVAIDPEMMECIWEYIRLEKEKYETGEASVIDRIDRRNEVEKLSQEYEMICIATQNHRENFQKYLHNLKGGNYATCDISNI